LSQINKLYRNFIILQEDERGHSSTSDKTLSGYSKIEAKGERCKVSFYAQNLRKDSGDYNIMLICNKRDSKQLIDLGKIDITDGGKGECTKEYFTDNVAGLDIPFDKICGAAIVRMKDGTPIFIMCGFMNGDQPSDNWKNYKVTKAVDVNSKAKMEMPKKETSKKDSDKKSDKKKDKDKDKCKEADDNKEHDKSKYYDDHKEQEDNKCECKREDEVVAAPIEEIIPIEEVVQVEELVQIEEVIQIEKVDPRGKFEEYEESIQTEKVDPRGKFEDDEEIIKKESKEVESSSDTFEVRGSVGEYFEGIARGFENCKDKYKEIKYCKWYEVKVNDLYEMCNMSNYNRYTVAYYPMLNYYPYIKKHGRFMLGYKCDREGKLKYLVYGVPGRKDKDEQPYEGKTGFVTWISDSDNDRDGMGCWLMFYDFKNSTVVVPMQ